MPITPAKKKNITMWLVTGSVVIASLAIIGAVYYSGLFKKDCRVIERRYCDEGTPIVYDGQPAMAFNVPEGTKIYAPFDGAFFEEDDNLFARGTVGIIDSSTFFKFVGLHSPAYRGGESVMAGEVVATVAQASEFIYEDTQSNLVIYFVDAELSDYFDIR